MVVLRDLQEQEQNETITRKMHIGDGARATSDFSDCLRGAA